MSPLKKIRDTPKFYILIGTIFGFLLLMNSCSWFEKEEKPVPVTAVLIENLIKDCAEGDEASCKQLISLYNQGSRVDAKSLLDRGCKAENGDACFALSEIYGDPDNPDHEPALALSLVESSCQFGVARGCEKLGRMYAEGMLVPQNDVVAFSFFLKACKDNYGPGCDQVGHSYQKGLGIQANLAAAFANYQLACDAMDPSGCRHLALLYQDGLGVKLDLKPATALFAKACNLDQKTGCKQLGDAYKNGFGIAPDPAKAREAYQLACDNTIAEGCAELGEYYQFGTAGKADLKIAHQLYRKSCDVYNPFGCYRLGRLYRIGAGVDIDLTQASKLFHMACLSDYAIACFELGELTTLESNSPSALTQAADYFQEACPTVAEACFRAGQSYEKGWGREIDLVKSTAFYQQGCNGDSAEACYAQALSLPKKAFLERLGLLTKACHSSLGKACFELGEDYRLGNEVKPDPKKSNEFYQQACQNGSYIGCYQQAKTSSSDSDPQTIQALYMKACAHNVAAACYEEGLLLFTPEALAPQVEEAVVLLNQDCLGGVPESCFELALRYDKGNQVVQNYPTALKYADQACQGNLAEACVLLGQGLTREGVSSGQIAPVFLQACDLKNAEGCFLLAELYRLAPLEVTEPDVPFNLEKAAEYYEQACPTVGEACYQIGRSYETGKGQAIDKIKALAFYDQGCQAGIGEACYQQALLQAPDAILERIRLLDLACDANAALGCLALGSYYQDGKGVAPDLKQSLFFYDKSCQLKAYQGCYRQAKISGPSLKPELTETLYQKACDHNVILGCYELGLIKLSPQSKKSQIIEGLKLLNRSCDAKVAEACLELAQRYQQGNLIVQNFKFAQDYNRKACDLNNASGCLELGLSLAKNKKSSNSATKRFLKACLLGDPQGCFQLGERYRTGSGAAKNPVKALEHFTTACNGKVASGCYRMALMIEEDLGETPEQTVLDQMQMGYDTACQSGRATACYRIGTLIANGIWLPGNPPLAAQYWMGACNPNNLLSCAQLAKAYKNGIGVKLDAKRATELAVSVCQSAEDKLASDFPEDAKDLAQSSNLQGAACYQAGQAYETGIGTPKDLKTALAFYQNGCDRDQTEACVEVGRAYEFGNQVKTNLKTAFLLYEKACQQFEPLGCYRSGRMYRFGRGTVANPKVAAQRFRIACDGGVALGCYELGRLTSLGVGVPQNSQQAADLYALACPQSASACYRLGRNFQTGIGRKKDLKQATNLFLQGCDGSNATACYYLALTFPADALSDRLTRLTQGCSGKSGLACFALGDDFRTGKGVKVDQVQAQGFYRDACDYGNYHGCYQQAKLSGKDSDPKQIETLYQKACDHQVILGCYEWALIELTPKQPPEKVDHGIDLLQHSCTGGVIPACQELGRRYLEGDGLLQSLESAQTYYKKACDGRSSESCLASGLLLKRQNGSSKMISQLFLKACSFGSSLGCYHLGERYRLGKGIGQSDDKALENYTLSCKDNVPLGCYWQARLTELSLAIKPSKKPKVTATLLEQSYGQACDAGVTLACYHLASTIQTAKFLKPNPPLAAQTLEKGCLPTDHLTCFPLADRYRSGNGVKPDPKRATELYANVCNLENEPPTQLLSDDSQQLFNFNRMQGRACWHAAQTIDPTLVVGIYQKSCDWNWLPGCYRAAVAFDRGDGVDQMRETALNYYQQACNGIQVGQSFDPPLASELQEESQRAAALSCFNLGVDFREGGFVAPNLTEANRLFEKSCHLGLAKGCFNRALALQGSQEAVTFFKKSCDLGLNDACLLLQSKAFQ